MKKLYRSSNRILAGVCGGLGFPGVLLYIILMILMPNYNQIDNQ